VTDPPAFSAQAERRDGASLVTARGELDLAVADELSAVLDSAQAPTLVLDLRDVTFIDSSGLSVIVAAHQRARAAGARFALVVTRPSPVHRLLELCGLAQTLTLIDDPDTLLVA